MYALVNSKVSASIHLCTYVAYHLQYFIHFATKDTQPGWQSRCTIFNRKNRHLAVSTHPPPPPTPHTHKHTHTHTHKHTHTQIHTHTNTRAHLFSEDSNDGELLQIEVPAQQVPSMQVCA